jgi:hypothetical protein
MMQQHWASLHVWPNHVLLRSGLGGQYLRHDNIEVSAVSSVRLF